MLFFDMVSLTVASASSNGSFAQVQVFPPVWRFCSLVASVGFCVIIYKKETKTESKIDGEADGAGMYGMGSPRG
jgi:hypothetical protein